MKTSAITAAIATICIASAGASLDRMRNSKIHRTNPLRAAGQVARVRSDEPYDQYLGLSKGKDGSNNKSLREAAAKKSVAKSTTPMSMVATEVLSMATTAGAGVMSMPAATTAVDTGEAHSSEDGHEKGGAHDHDHDHDHGADGHSDDGDGEAKALSGGSAWAVSASAGVVGLFALAYNIV